MIGNQKARGLKLEGLACVSAGALLTVLALAPAAYAQTAISKFDVPAQPLDQALLALGRQASISVAVPQGLVAGKTASAIEGELRTDVALNRLLDGTGLRAEFFAPDVVRIVQAGEGGGPQSDSAAGGGAEVEALVVTAQKKEEAIQDVPIAISAFTQKSLDAQKIEGGFDLLKAIPNVTFSKSNFSGYNFSIRGIGTKAVSATTDPGVAVAFNNTTLIVNRLFEQEYFDVERVEVLRGPQGTLYGRNATAGVINVLSARPRLGEFEGDVKVELGNYNAQRVKGMVNFPIGETLAIRAAGAMTKRDGYGTNLAAGTENDNRGVSADVDGRDLWSARVTVGWEPIEAIRVNAMWEKFEEDDNRVRTSKQLCHHDAGPEPIGSYFWPDQAGMTSTAVFGKAQTSQGCKAGSLYDDAAFGTPNGASLPYVNALYTANFWGSQGTIISGNGALGYPGLGGNPYFSQEGFFAVDAYLEPPCVAAATTWWFSPIDACRPDPYGGQMQSRDLRTIFSLIEPKYQASSDVYELSLDIDLTDSLTFTSQTVYATDSYYATQDYNRFTTFEIFNDSNLACDVEVIFGSVKLPSCPGVFTPTPDHPEGWYNVTPGGVFDDPQFGPTKTLVAQDLSRAKSEQFNQEFRLVSNFDNPINFSLGANFTHFETVNDYFVFLNTISLLTHFFPFNVHPGSFPNINPCVLSDGAQDVSECVYVDPNPLESINGEGHNYFRSANPYELTSSAIFGELYWQATDTLKVTLGARMSWDEKVFTPIPSQLLLMDYRYKVAEGLAPEACFDALCKQYGTGVRGRGSPAEPDIVQAWREPTGRIIVDWKPDLGFTDETMVYGSIAHGYKGGGANPPGIARPSGLLNAEASRIDVPPTFEPEFINAYEIGTKNTLLDGALILNGSAFYYDYEGYQVSKIVNRSASNENFDTKVWGAELEWIFSPTRNLRFNGTFGALRTKIGEGQRSIDLMNRHLGGTPQTSWIDKDGVEHALGYDRWMVLKPWVSYSSNCVVPVEVAEMVLVGGSGLIKGPEGLNFLCPGGNPVGNTTAVNPYSLPDGRFYNATTEAPNGGAGFYTEVGGNELPNAPHWTSSLGAQYRIALPGGWDATLRSDFYWQSQSFARVYNTQYDKLRAWTNANVSFWVENPDWGVTAEVYVKNVFDETPITDAFLNSDDSGLTTNVFTLDPRLIGVSVRKSF